MSARAAPASLRRGKVHGRYFRENFAQGGIDLVQILPELVTNADAAIAASGRERGRIELYFGPPDADFLERWQSEVDALGVPALKDWTTEVRCTDDGIGVDTAAVDRRLGALGALPEAKSQRGLFGRGLRDVWLAQGGGRIQGTRKGRVVESWFFPAAGDDPYVYEHVLDKSASEKRLRKLELERGARVTVPLAQAHVPAPGRLRTLVSDLVQLRPVLEDPDREVLLALAGELATPVVFAPPEPDPERPILLDAAISLGGGVEALVTVRRSAEPIALSSARALRRGGLVIRSGRGAHEATLVGHESRVGARHLYGEVRCEAIERLQREALESPRPEVVVKVDRSGLNENHPVVRKLYAALDKLLRPIIDEEERRAGSNLVSAGREMKARDQVGLKALNDLLRSAFDAPGTAGFSKGGSPSREPPAEDPPDPEPSKNGGPPEREAGEAGIEPLLGGAIRFNRSPVRVHPGEQRSVSLLVDPRQIPPGTPVSIAADTGLTASPLEFVVPEPQKLGWSRLQARLRARVSVDPGSRLFVIAEAGEHWCELEVLIVRHRASGWVREIARKEIDSVIEAEFDPESGVVTVFEGRREFRAMERAARRAGLSKRRVREYLPYRMLEVEAAANAVYAWAAERVVARRFSDSGAADPAEYAAAIRLEAQTLRHRAHEKLMRAFLEPEVFEGGVRIKAQPAQLP